MRTRVQKKPSKYLHRLLKFAALIILILLSVSVFGDYGTRDGEADVDLSSLSAAKDAGPEMPEGTVLWKLGKHDGSAGEFKAAGSSGVKKSLSIASTTARSAELKSLPSGLHGETNPELRIQYELDKIPEHGVLFRVSIIDAYKSVPQMSVFSNRQLSGIIQIAGIAGTGSKYDFRKTYELYIPKEQLISGTNELTLRTARESIPQRLRISTTGGHGII